MKAEHLHLLINEELYLLDENSSGKVAEVQKEDPSQPAPAIEEKMEVLTEKPETVEPTIQTPKIPIESTVEKVRVAFIHHSDNTNELELLSKIVSACQLEPSEFKLFKTDDGIEFEKAIVFREGESTYYQAFQHENRTILASKPLHILMNSKEEKGMLWSALKQFL